MERKKRNQRHSYYTKEINKVRKYMRQIHSNIFYLKRELNHLIGEDRVANRDEILLFSNVLENQRYILKYMNDTIKRYKGYVRSASRYEKTY